MAKVRRNKNTAAAAGKKHKHNKKSSQSSSSRKNNQWTKNHKKESSKGSAQGGDAISFMSKSSSSSRSTPPWQVMSKKDQAKNVIALKEQREYKKANPNAKPKQLPQPKIYSSDMSNQNTLLPSHLRSLLSWKRFKPGTMAGGAGGAGTLPNSASSSSSSSSSNLVYVGSYLNHHKPPSLGVPEIAFLGRSNVGKSSLLNKLVSSNIARVGKTPGATASVNLYAIQSSTKNTPKPLLGLVDLPGFGYAKLSKSRKESVEMAAETYLNQRMELALGILLVDARRDPSMDDKAVLAALYDLNVPLCVVATKVDKLKVNERDASIQRINVGLGLPKHQPLVISSVTGEGVKDLWNIIMDACEEKVADLKQQNTHPTQHDEDHWYTQDDDEEEIFQDGEDLVYDQGYDWIHGTHEMQSQDSYMDHDDPHHDPYHDPHHDSHHDTYSHNQNEDDYENTSKRKMLENQEQQARENEAMKLKNLKKVARRLDRRGEI